MPRGLPSPWTQRDCRFDYLVVAAAGTGMGQEITMQGIESPERAREICKGFYRCRDHRKLGGWVKWQHSGEWTTTTALWPPDRQPDGTYTLMFAVVDKNAARRRHIAVNGTDRSKWAYNPRGTKSQADIDAWASQGRTEKGHRVR
jgi:hypothetical protein